VGGGARVPFNPLWFIKEQSQKQARKLIKVGCCPKVTLVYKGLSTFCGKGGNRLYFFMFIFRLFGCVFQFCHIRERILIFF
jgi:hypothetical protein